MPFRIGIDARKLHDFGIGTYIENLVRGLAEIDTENEYVLFVGAGGRDLLEDLPENFRLLPESSPVYSLRELFVLSWSLFRARLDLYHATHYVLPALVHCPSVVTIHDIIHLLYPEFLPSPIAFLYAQRMIRRSLGHGARILADSRNTKEDLERYFNVSPSKVEVVYPGVAERFRQRLERQELEATLASLQVESPYLLFVGNPKPHKNLDTVIRAYARARRLHAFDAPLVCVGDRGAAQFRIRQLAEQLGIGRQVRLLGHVAAEVLPAIYQGASLFLYPTLYEGFGLPVVEAMASGVPVITSRTSALREIAEGYAALVDPLDVEGLAHAIVRCLRDSTFREALVAKGLQRAESFRWRTTAEATRRIYLSVLGGEERSAGSPP